MDAIRRMLIKKMGAPKSETFTYPIVTTRFDHMNIEVIMEWNCYSISGEVTVIANQKQIWQFNDRVGSGTHNERYFKLDGLIDGLLII